MGGPRIGDVLVHVSISLPTKLLPTDFHKARYEI